MSRGLTLLSSTASVYWFFQCISAISANVNITLRKTNKTTEICFGSQKVPHHNDTNETCNTTAHLEEVSWIPRFSEWFSIGLLVVVSLFLFVTIAIAIFSMRKFIFMFHGRQETNTWRVENQHLKSISHFIIDLLLRLFHCSFSVIIDCYVFYRTELGYVLHSSITYNSLIEDAMVFFIIFGCIGVAIFVWSLTRTISSKSPAITNITDLAFILQFIFQDSPMAYLQYFYIEKYTNKRNVLWCVIIKSLVLIILSSRVALDTVNLWNIYYIRPRWKRKLGRKEKFILDSEPVTLTSSDDYKEEAFIDISVPMHSILTENEDQAKRYSQLHISQCSSEDVIPSAHLSTALDVMNETSTIKQQRWGICLTIICFSILSVHILHVSSSCYHYSTSTHEQMYNAACLAEVEGGKLLQIPLTKNCLNVLDIIFLAVIMTTIFFVTIVLPLFGLVDEK